MVGSARRLDRLSCLRLLSICYKYYLLFRLYISIQLHGVHFIVTMGVILVFACNIILDLAF